MHGMFSKSTTRQIQLNEVLGPSALLGGRFMRCIQRLLLWPIASMPCLEKVHQHPRGLPPQNPVSALGIFEFQRGQYFTNKGTPRKKLSGLTKIAYSILMGQLLAKSICSATSPISISRRPPNCKSKSKRYGSRFLSRSKH